VEFNPINGRGSPARPARICDCKASPRCSLTSRLWSGTGEDHSLEFARLAGKIAVVSYVGIYSISIFCGQRTARLEAKSPSAPQANALFLHRENAKEGATETVKH